MNELDTKILKLSQVGGIETLLEIEKLLEQALNKDPHNIDLLLRLAILEQEVPLADHERSTSILENILKRDPSNAIALLLLSYVNYYCIPGILNESLFQKLISLKTGNKETDSMLKYAASWFYTDHTNNNNLEQLLKESIKTCQSHVYNYSKLAGLYLKQNRPTEAKLLVQKALKNVVKIYTDEDCHDITNVQEFLGERIKGIYLTTINFQTLKKIEMEAIIREQLKQDPLNLELLLKLSTIEIMKYQINYKGIASLEKILSIDSNNVIALLLLAYVDHSYKKMIDAILFQKLTSIKTSNPEINSMLLYAASWFYVDNDKRREELLRQSINEYPYHVRNYLDLAMLYSHQNKPDIAKDLIKKALNNIVKVYSFFEDIESFGDVESFLNKYIKGIYQSEQSYNGLKEMLDTDLSLQKAL